MRNLLMDRRSIKVSYSCTETVFYGPSPYHLIPFVGSTSSSQQRRHNACVCRVRTGIERGFRDVKIYFTHIDFPRKMTIPRVAVAMVYVVSVIQRSLEFGCADHEVQYSSKSLFHPLASTCHVFSTSPYLLSFCFSI